MLCCAAAPVTAMQFQPRRDGLLVRAAAPRTAPAAPSLEPGRIRGPWAGCRSSLHGRTALLVVAAAHGMAQGALAPALPGNECPDLLKQSWLTRDGHACQAVGMLDGRVQLFQAEEFQSQRPPLAPALTLEPCQVDTGAGAGHDALPTSGRLPVDFLQWRNEGDILVSVSEDDGRWRVGGWHMLQNSVGDWSALPATESLLAEIVSPAELARMAAARANPLDAAALKSGRDRRAEMSRSSGSLSILGDVNPPAFSDSFQHVALASRVASATILEDLPASPQLIADGMDSDGPAAASSPALSSASDPPALQGAGLLDGPHSCPSSPNLRQGATARDRPSSRRYSAGRPASAPGSAGGISRQVSAPPMLRKLAHRGAGRQAHQAGGYSPPAQQQQQQQGRGARVPRTESAGAILEPAAGSVMHPIFQPVIYVPVHLANAAFMAQEGAVRPVLARPPDLACRPTRVRATSRCPPQSQHRHVLNVLTCGHDGHIYIVTCASSPAQDGPRITGGAAAHLMPPFPGSPPALFQPMPSGVWPQQMFANFGSPAAGPSQGIPHHHQPPPPPPPPQQQQQQQRRRGQPAAECQPEPRVQTPTSPLSPAPSYKRSSRSDGASLLHGQACCNVRHA